MSWQPNTTNAVDPTQAESAGSQAGQFLVAAIHGEIDGAVIDPVHVLMDPHSPGMAVYAVAAVLGPLRAYLATAWGRAGHVAAKQIVSHPSIDEARQAAASLIGQRTAGQDSERTYVQIGTFLSDTAG